MKFCVVGSKGNLGRFYTNLLKDYEVFGVDKNNLQDLRKNALMADIVILALPHKEICKNLNLLKDILKEDQLLLNLSSLMTNYVEQMKELKCSCAFLHGLFAPNVNSLKNTKFILAPIKTNKKLSFFVSLLEGKGGKIIRANADEHDEAMALIQALSHFNGILLAKTVSDSKITTKDMEKYSTLYSRLYFDVISRIFSQTPETYINLQLENNFFDKILNLYEQNLYQLKSIIEKKDYKKYEYTFLEVEKNIGGFLKKSFKESKNIAEIVNTKKTKVAILGPRGSFTDEACDAYGSEAEKVFFESIKDIVSAVDTGIVDLGIIPLENSIGGTIAESVDQIYEKGLNIKKTLILPIRYCSASISKNVEPEVVMGHPQSFLQCSEYIEKKFPEAKRVHTLSNSEAFKKIEENNLINAVALGSEYAAKLYNLKIIESQIQNNSNNKTRFAVINKSKKLASGKKTSIVINPGKDRPGLLFDLLKHIRDNEINLCRIESRPSKEKLGAYIFHLEFDGGVYDQKIQEALKKIKKESDITILGSYNQVELTEPSGKHEKKD